MLVISGERRFMAVDFANDPGVVAGATLSSGLSIEIVEKRGEEAVAGVVESTPTPPAISGTQGRFWADWDGVEPARYKARAQVTLSNGEVAFAEADIVVE